jgi:hypothetical protein
MRTEAPLATVDVRELNTVAWGPIRAMFPAFAEEIELARYLKELLLNSAPCAVTVEPHRSADGRPSSHVFDIYRVQEVAAA